MRLGNYIQKKILPIKLSKVFYTFLLLSALIVPIGLITTPTGSIEFTKNTALAGPVTQTQYNDCKARHPNNYQSQCLPVGEYTQSDKADVSTQKNGSWCVDAGTCVSGVIYMFSVGLGGILAYMGSSVLNLGVQLSLQSEAYSQLFLTTGWAAARDIANMLFIFILIYIAFTIIYSAETANTMKTLAAVIVMALLINFSFFITRVVIDAGNILAVQFYNSIDAPSMSQTASNSTLAATTNQLGFSPGDKKDLTFYVMETVKVQNILNEESFKRFNDQNGFFTNVIVQSTIYLVVGWTFAIIALTFFAVGFKFLLRIIVLWFVIIAAPLAFAMRAFASNETARKLYNEWQSALIKFSFYPAVFLFMFMIMNYIMREMGGSGQGLIPGLFEDLASLKTGDSLTALGAAMAHVIIRLGFVVVMLLFGLKLADQIMLSGSTFAENFTRRASEKMKGFAYRNTAGRALYSTNKALERSKWANQPGAVGWIGTKLRKQSFALANKSYGGVRSRAEVVTNKDNALKERQGLLAKIKDQEKAATNKALLSARNERIKSVVEKLDVANPGKTSKEDIRLLESLSKPVDLESLGEEGAAKMARSAIPGTPYANIWNADKNRTVKDISSFTADGQTNIYSAHQDALEKGQEKAAAELNKKEAEIEQKKEKDRDVASQIVGVAEFKGPSFNQRSAAVIRNSVTQTDTNSAQRPQPRMRNSRLARPDMADRLLEKIDAGWANVKPREPRAAELAGLDKALTGVAEVAARAQARAATQPPTARSLSVNQPADASTQTKNIPIDTTHSMPARVSRLDPAHTEPETSAAAAPQTTPTSTPATPKVPAPKTSLASWWSVPKDAAAEQLKALHGIKEELEGMREHAAQTPRNRADVPPVTINQTVVQAGNTPPTTITPEAKELLASIDKGGAPKSMTPELRRTLQQAGIKNSDISQKPLGELLEQLRKSQA